MSPFAWFSRLFAPTPSRKPRAHSPYLAAIAQDSATLNAPPTSSAYEQSPWVYVAINRIAEAAALVPLHVYRQTPQGEETLPQHPLLALLDNPNPTTSRFELLEQTLGHLELHGNAYWYVLGDEAGRPAQLWALRPERVTIVPDPVHVVRGYVYSIDGQQVPLEAVEVVHFKRWHPHNDLYGLSALSAARLALANDRAMAEWNANTFGRDHGVPAGIVNIKTPISDQDFERLKHEWRTHYGSAQRRTAFLRGGEVEWIHVGLSHTDLDFLKGRQAQRDEILNIFGIPIGMLSENATEANALVAERLFIERTLWPKLVRLSQKISQDLLPFWGAGCVARFQDIRPTDAQARLGEMAAARGILTLDELRARYFQLPPLGGPGGTALAGQPTAESPTQANA